MIIWFVYRLGLQGWELIGQYPDGTDAPAAVGAAVVSGRPVLKYGATL